jgi:Mg2+-importing ATPase
MAQAHFTNMASPSIPDTQPGLSGGLTSAEAAAKLAEFGPNEALAKKRRSPLLDLLLLFVNPLAVILLFAAVLSGFLGQSVDAGIIVVMVVLGNLINFFQTFRSQAAAEKLRLQVLPSATVLRDGAWNEVPQRLVVPGDVIRLSAGDLVPADSMLIEAKDLHVQQAALTGESFPVEKNAVAGSQPTDKADSEWMVFLGTSVVSGSAKALVIATGVKTSYGGIAERLSVRPEETEFERGIRRFGGLIMQTVFVLVMFLIIVSVAQHHNVFESLLFAVALAVGLTPEFLPMITSVTLARGAVEMAKKRVIVKHLASIQNFGSIDVLCSDKTGTLTGGTMKIDRALDPLGNESERVFTLGWLNSKYETGIRSPLDTAILERPCPVATQYEKLDEIPFDFERRRVSIVLKRGVPPTEERLLIAKGSPEGIEALCATYEVAGKIVEFDGESRAACKRRFQELSTQGFRVLAVAYRAVESHSAYSIRDEVGLCFGGYITFSDPPLADAAQMVAALKRDGVELKIVTGDNELVTRYVCERVGLDASTIVLGDDLESMTDPALGQVAETTSIFARVSPAQKNRIILALKHRGHAVGYMGDGINDAPSLHAADVGISVSTAVDVARDAADIILVEPGLGILHAGILEGRKAFGNVMKYLLMGTSSNFGNMFSMAGASVLLPFLPMLPTQILLNNFLYDLAQITIPTDNVDQSYIARPQRWDISVIRKFMLIIGPISSIYDFLTFYVLLHFFHANEKLFHTGWFVESLATQTLVLFVIRTRGNPLKSRPSLPLTVTIVAIVLIGMAIPFSPLAAELGFVPLPLSYFLFLAGATATYLALVEVGKQLLFRRHRPEGVGTG